MHLNITQHPHGAFSATASPAGRSVVPAVWPTSQQTHKSTGRFSFETQTGAQCTVILLKLHEPCSVLRTSTCVLMRCVLLLRTSTCVLMRCVLSWDIPQRMVVIPCRRFGTTYRFRFDRLSRNVGKELPPLLNIPEVRTKAGAQIHAQNCCFLRRT